MNQVKRKCVVTNEIVPTNELLRFVLTPEKEIKYDHYHKMNGRGAYVKNDLEIINDFFNKKRLNKSFKRNIPNQTYIELRQEVEKYGKTK